jgi:LPPG:FO 2-phospho-L-lactate transferase
MEMINQVPAAAVPRVVVFVGGVGGAKLAYGLSQVLPPEQLTVIVNVADDFWHYGLRISPDLDTIMYTLSDLVDPVNGWGIADDTTAMLKAMQRYGEETWFTLKDQDLATHLLRTQWLQQGVRLTEITRRLASRLGIGCTVLPVTDDSVMTMVHTEENGTLEFQEYFVRYRWQPRIRSLEYRGAADAHMTPEVRNAIENADVILFGPSNPWLSIAPILAVSEVANLVKSRNIPRIAVTPIVDGRAIKGPAAKMMEELGLEVSPQSVMQFYSDLLNGFIKDVRDGGDNSEDANNQTRNLHLSGYLLKSFDTMMGDAQSKIRLSQNILEALEGWKL